MNNYLLGTVALSCLLISCDEDKSDVEPQEWIEARAQLLKDVTNNVFLPQHQELVSSTEQLSRKAQSFCADVSASKLEEVRTAWYAAAAAEERVEYCQLGPVKDLRTIPAIDFRPPREVKIEEVLSGTDPLSIADVAKLGASQKGLPVLEYLLFGVDGKAEYVLQTFTATSASGLRHCNYLQGVALGLVSESEKLQKAWLADGDNYQQTLVSAGEGSAAFMSQHEALEDLFSALINGLQRLESNKLGGPLGLKQNGVVQPRAAEAWRSQQSVALLKVTMQALQQSYTSGMSAEGKAGVGFDDLIKMRNAELATQIDDAINRVNMAIDAVDSPLFETVETDRPAVQAAFDSSKDLLRLFAADVAAVLGVTPTFGDVDGD